MTKAELVTFMSKEVKNSKASAEKSLNAFQSGLTKALKKGEKMTLTGFGTFSVVKRGKRKGRNPQSGKEIIIPAKKVVKFKAGNKLKEAIK
ncbi:MAG: DNA-binding protein [Deltaproteobacteria bacterium RBG_16_47_11]|nr:MAG: DNA-binding protein [Deltaproteobacteria bacterium RBG_16_47_11]